MFCAVQIFPCGSNAPQFLQVHQVHSLFSLCELQTLSCRPVRSCNRIPILFPTLPTTSGNLLTTFCKNLQIKHAAVVTNPQTQRLHFKNDWWVWVVSYSFLIELGDFAQQWKQRRTQRSRAKGLLPVGCCLCAPEPGVQDCGEMLKLAAQGPESPCWEPGVCEHPRFPCSGFSLCKFILQDPRPLNAKQAL